ncbi:FN3 associated domain-containing protein [Flavivirga algicola]|uniref:Cytochrome c domain-containing protein n=1 Tax=Flavivirga algicola TaxID=2729136 RepID=A0ABX1S1P2_9FLAO|nr:FN3 associated domain-containing protein [Flavivirga algicola]NMH89271.1 hypothetical protein [Flavivirga algicola]
MKKLESFVLNILFLLHCFLVMMLIFENSVTIPYWLQPLGRMHPLVLHFPIVCIFFLVILSFFKKRIDLNTFKKIKRFLVLFTAFTTTLATIMGLFLSMEGDTTKLMILHKWIGVGISFLIYLLIFVKKDNVFNAILYISFVGVIFAGHYGAGLTHGINFITEPLAKNKIVEINEHTPIFKGFVKPILDAKCVSCHNSEKQKGDLDMSTFNRMILGGKNGELFIAYNTTQSALLKRVHLPIEHKKHMPPQGKKQLTKTEIKLLTAWIDQGANNTVSLIQLPKQDTLGLIISKLLQTKKEKVEPEYAFNFAKEKDIIALQNPFRTVIQKSPFSPALDVVIHGRQTYEPEFLTDLAIVKKQIVSLNLSYLPIDKSSINFVSSLTNLENLVLNFTNLTSEGLQPIKACKKLKTLSISGTKIDVTISTTLNQLPNLKKVYLWNTSISENDIKTLKTQFPNIYIETGFKGSDEKLKLASPILVSKNTVISKDDFIELGHKIPGVEIRYTVDGSKPNKLSLLYEKPIKIDLNRNKPIKTIAYKNNWLPSKIQNYSFVDKGFTPVKFDVVYQGYSSAFIGDAETILIDNNKGKITFNIQASPFWVTFNKKHHLNAIADFGENAPDIRKLVLSYGMHNRQKKEPLESFELWAGYDKDNLKLIKQVKKTYRKIDKNKEGKYRKIEVKISKNKYRYYKIIAVPFEKEALYVDQIYFY